MAIAFYCLSTLDLTGRIEHKMSATDRENWQEWIWAQYVGKPRHAGCAYLLASTPYKKSNRRRLLLWSVISRTGACACAWTPGSKIARLYKATL